MKKITQWAMAQQETQDFHPQYWGKALGANLELPTLFNGPTTYKLMGAKVHHFHPSGHDLNNTIILGGACLLSRADMKRISSGALKFETIHHFEGWLRSWYPRIDLIHDTVGIPPKSCRKIIYVVEDSFFAERLARQTGFDKVAIQTVLRNTHNDQGARVLKNWLSCFGYKGELQVIYTSQIDSELSVTLRIWERILGFTFRAGDVEFAKTELMYTGFWQDILGISKIPAIVYEPAVKLATKGWIHTGDWCAQNPYGIGINKNMGIAGYVPFMSSGLDLGSTQYDMVPNLGNYKEFIITDENLAWYTANFLFGKKTVHENGLQSLTPDAIREFIKGDLFQFYNI